MARSNGRAGNKDGCSLEGPRTKRRRDDLAANMEPRAKRGAYMEGHPLEVLDSSFHSLLCILFESLKFGPPKLECASKH